ncbi:MAG: zinc metalloprotease HtpX [Candidatus Woesearchaeota archaeon]
MIYKRIESNKRKTFFLIFFFILFILLLGLAFDYLLGFGTLGLIVALIISLTTTLISYYNSDKIVLSMTRAYPAEKKDYPYYVNSVEALAAGAGIPVPKIYVLPEQSINAFATGTSPQRASIAVTEGALKKLSRQELEGVIGHEISHIKNYDMRIMTITAVLVGVVSILSDFAIRNFWYETFRRKRSRDSEGLNLVILVIGLIFIALAPIFAQIIKFAISRKREFLADADSALLTHNPKGLIGALKKIEQENIPMKRATTATAHLYISNPLPKNFLSNLFATHPPIEERIKALENL